jgi:hypothetical protein
VSRPLGLSPDVLKTTALIRTAGAVALLVLASPLAAQKVDLIYLTNGDRIRGEIKALERGMLEYKTDDLGTVSVKWDKIDEIESPRFFDVELRNGVRRFGSLARADQPGFVVLRGGVVDTLPLLDVVLITPIRASFLTRLDGHVDIGYTLTRADNQQEITVQGAVAYRGRDLGARLEGSSYFRVRSGDQRTSRNSVSLTGQRFLPKRWAIWVQGHLQQNDELQLDLRSTFSIGPAREIARTNSLDLSLFAGGAFTRERYATTDSAAYNAELVLGGQFAAFRHDTPKLDFTTDLRVFPNVTDWGRVRSDLQMRLRYEVLKDFTVGLTGFYQLDTRPPDPTTPNQDYSLSTTLGYTF